MRNPFIIKCLICNNDLNYTKAGTFIDDSNGCYECKKI